MTSAALATTPADFEIKYIVSNCDGAYELDGETDKIKTYDTPDEAAHECLDYVRMQYDAMSPEEIDELDNDQLTLLLANIADDQAQEQLSNRQLVDRLSALLASSLDDGKSVSLLSLLENSDDIGVDIEDGVETVHLFPCGAVHDLAGFELMAPF